MGGGRGPGTNVSSIFAEPGMDLPEARELLHQIYSGAAHSDPIVGCVVADATTCQSHQFKFADGFALDFVRISKFNCDIRAMHVHGII